MSNAINPQLRAQVLRDLAQETHLPNIKEWLESAADSYDPPRPQIEPGTLCEAEHENGGILCGYWVGDGLAVRRDAKMGLFDANLLTNIRPVQQLTPTQVAVDVPQPTHWPRAATYVAFLISYSMSPVHNDDIARSISIEQARRMWTATGEDQWT